MILQLRSAIALFTCNCLIGVAVASSSSVGLVMTTGVVEVDGQRVPGNSAIFSGSRVFSGDKTSNLQFSDGTSAVMNPGTTMTVYQERSVLQQGVTTQRGIDKHAVLANGLKISSTTANATAQVGVKNDSYMEVFARDGEADVWNASGKLVARVEPGQPLSFTYQQQQPPPQQPPPPPPGPGAAPASVGGGSKWGEVLFIAAIAAAGSLIGVAAANSGSSSPAPPPVTPAVP